MNVKRNIVKEINDTDTMDDGIVDLTIKRSDSFPKSPSQVLVAQVTDSPRTTKFEWIENNDNDSQDSFEPVEGINNEMKPGDDDPQKFLNKVEELFNQTEEL